MNTEQLKTAKEFLREASGSIRADEYHLINVMNSFAYQESNRAVDEFKEKLKREIRENSVVLYDASARFALVDGLNTMIDKL